MANSSAKQAIVDAFIDKVEAGSLRAVQVAKLIKEIDVNRNTFYYHFPSKSGHEAGGQEARPRPERLADNAP